MLKIFDIRDDCPQFLIETHPCMVLGSVSALLRVELALLSKLHLKPDFIQTTFIFLVRPQSEIVNNTCLRGAFTSCEWQKGFLPQFDLGTTTRRANTRPQDAFTAGATHRYKTLTFPFRITSHTSAENSIHDARLVNITDIMLYIINFFSQL